MKQYEYTSLEFYPNAILKLNKLGKDGWKVVTTVEPSHQKADRTLILMREIQPDPNKQ